jgi:hypothetical protein
MPGSEFVPNAGDTLINPVTGAVTEIGRRLFRTLSESVGQLAPTTARYWVSRSESVLSEEQNLGALATGYLKIITTLGTAAPSTVAAIPVSDVATLKGDVYTPVIFNVANLSASTSYSCQYLRVDKSVTVSGRVDIDPVAAATLTQLGIALPIASTFTNTNECAGTGVSPDVAGQCAAIYADVANARAMLQWVSADVANRSMFFQFTYRVL